MRDIEVRLSIEVKPDVRVSEDEQNLRISYIINECCSKLEELKCSPSYRMFQDGKRIFLREEM